MPTKRNKTAIASVAKQISTAIEEAGEAQVKARARLLAARQDTMLVQAAGIVNGMSQDAIDERLLAVLDAHQQG